MVMTYWHDKTIFIYSNFQKVDPKQTEWKNREADKSENTTFHTQGR